MGSIILCSKKKAANPYEITRVHKRISTMEELCYYLIHNVYLVDNTIMNEQFCKWLEEELDLAALATTLKDAMLDRCGREKFILIIVKNSNIYAPSDLHRIEDVLNQIKEKNDIECRKSKGDNLLRNGEVEEAILVYQAILREKWDETLTREFYGKVYACLGAAFGQCFLYNEAMEMYDEAFQICNDPMLVKCYLYAAKKAMSEKEYRLFLSKSEVFQELDEIIIRETRSVKQSLVITPSTELLEEWKLKYRQGSY